MPQGEAQIASVAIRQLTIADFRNHAATRIEAEGGLIAITGANGAGKTNLLEAVSLLAPGRGLRRAAFADMARAGGERWAVAARLRGMDGEARIGMEWRASEGGDGNSARRLLVNGKAPRSSAELGRHLRIGWLTPAMDRIFGGPAGERRRFFDRLTAALDPQHAARAGTLERLLRQRNRLLEEARPDAAWLDAVEARLAEAAVAVAAARLAALEALRGGMAALEGGGAFPFARLGLQGWVEDRLGESPAVEVEDAYREALARGRRRDAAAGRTLEGPHRTDLEVEHGPKAMAARLCSTGEQKALLIALIMAHAAAVKAQAGHAPVLLLDEVAAHLDAARRAGLFRALEALGCQAWMTGTDEGLFEDIRGRAQFLRIDDGRIT